MEEMEGIASRALPLVGKSLQRAEAALKAITAGDGHDEASIRAEFGHYFEAVA